MSNIELGVKLHNKFELELIDAKSGEVKQRAMAYNLVTNYGIARLNAKDATFSNYLHLGSGTGTPAVTDTGLFTLQGYASTSVDSRSYDLPNAWVRLKATFAPENIVDKALTEVGLSCQSINGYLFSHALLVDSENNPITITKTGADILIVYATIYVNITAPDYFLLCLGPKNYILSYILKVGTCFSDKRILPSSVSITPFKNKLASFYPSTSSVYGTSDTSQYHWSTFGAENLALLPAGTTQYLTGYTGRVSVSQWNIPIREVAFANYGNLLLPNSANPAAAYTGVSVGTGDGVKVKFALPSYNTYEAGLTVYVNGVATTVTLNKVNGYNTLFMSQYYLNPTNTNQASWGETGIVGLLCAGTLAVRGTGIYKRKNGVFTDLVCTFSAVVSGMYTNYRRTVYGFADSGFTIINYYYYNGAGSDLYMPVILDCDIVGDTPVLSTPMYALASNLPKFYWSTSGSPEVYRVTGACAVSPSRKAMTLGTNSYTSVTWNSTVYQTYLALYTRDTASGQFNACIPLVCANIPYACCFSTDGSIIAYEYNYSQLRMAQYKDGVLTTTPAVTLAAADYNCSYSLSLIAIDTNTFALADHNAANTVTTIGIFRWVDGVCTPITSTTVACYSTGSASSMYYDAVNSRIMLVVSSVAVYAIDFANDTLTVEPLFIANKANCIYIGSNTTVYSTKSAIYSYDSLLDVYYIDAYIYPYPFSGMGRSAQCPDAAVIGNTWQHSVVFETPPASGAVITADYTVDGIDKTDQYVMDVSCSYTFSADNGT